MAGVLRDENVDALTIWISPDAECPSDEHARAYEMIPGVHWLLGWHAVDGGDDSKFAPMFRQELNKDGLNSHQLYLICSSRGWRIRMTPEAAWPESDDAENTLAWLGMGPGLPKKGRVPYWRAKANAAFRILPSHAASRNDLEIMAKTMFAKEEEVEALKLEAAGLREAAAQPVEGERESRRRWRMMKKMTAATTRARASVRAAKAKERRRGRATRRGGGLLEVVGCSRRRA